MPRQHFARYLSQVRPQIPPAEPSDWKDFVLFSLSEAGAVCNSTPLGSIVTTPLFSLCFQLKTKNWFQQQQQGRSELSWAVSGGEYWAVRASSIESPCGQRARAINNKYKELRPTTARTAKYKIQIPSYIIQWGTHARDGIRTHNSPQLDILPLEIK